MLLFQTLFFNFHSRIKFVVVVVVSLIAIAFAWEEFPYSTYPMYSKIFEPEELIYWKVVAFNKTHGEEFEFPIRRIFWPYTQASFLESLSAHYEVGGEDSIRRIFVELVPLFNSRRGSLPEASSLRLYRLYYDWSKNKNLVLGSDQQVFMRPERYELLWDFGPD